MQENIYEVVFINKYGTPEKLEVPANNIIHAVNIMHGVYKDLRSVKYLRTEDRNLTLRELATTLNRKDLSALARELTHAVTNYNNEEH